MGDFCVKKQPGNRFTKSGCPLFLDKPVRRGLGIEGLLSDCCGGYHLFIIRLCFNYLLAVLGGR